MDQNVKADQLEQSKTNNSTFHTMEAAFRDAVESGKLHGAVLCARDASGEFVYEKAFGTRSTLAGETIAMEPTDILFMASATKLLTTVAALQCVDDGLLTLHEDVSAHLTEYKGLEVLTGFGEDKKPQFEPLKRAITLEDLLLHTAGWRYDGMDENQEVWKDVTGFNAEGKLTVPDRFLRPLFSQPGEVWAYGTSLDWAGKLVERVTGQTLESRMGERMFAPLGITDFQFYPVRREDLRAGMVDLNPDDPEGEGLRPSAGHHIHGGSTGECFGGHGIFMSAPSYCKVLASLLANDGKLLQPATANDMFRPHLNSTNRKAFDEMMSGEMAMFFNQGTAPETKRDWGLGGLLVMEDLPGWYQSNTLCWGGAFNTVWFIDRKSGLCGIGSPQIIQPPLYEFNARIKDTYRKGVFDVYQEWKNGRRAEP